MAIWIDGRNTGLLTPQTFAGLYAGLHAVEVKSDDGFTVRRDVTIPPEGTAEVSAAFPPILWTFTDGQLEFYNNPSVADDGTAYVVAMATENRCHLLAFGPDGQLLWNVPAADVMCGSPVIGDSGTVYVAPDGAVLAFGPDGALRWDCPLAETAATGIALGTDGVIYAACGKELCAIGATGVIQWTSTCPRSARTRPVVAGDGTIYLMAGAFVSAFSAGGTLKWSCPLVAGEAAPGLALDAQGNVYCRSAPEFYSINPAGAVRWKVTYSGDGPSTSPVVGADGTVYANMEGRFVALREDGGTKWFLGDPVASASGAPALGGDGSIYLGATGWGSPNVHYAPGLFCLNDAGGLQWRLTSEPPEHWRTPAISDSTLFVTEEHTLWAIRIPPVAADAPWPMFQHDPRHTGRYGTR